MMRNKTVFSQFWKLLFFPLWNKKKSAFSDERLEIKIEFESHVLFFVCFCFKIEFRFVFVFVCCFWRRFQNPNFLIWLLKVTKQHQQQHRRQWQRQRRRRRRRRRRQRRRCRRQRAASLSFNSSPLEGHRWRWAGTWEMEIWRRNFCPIMTLGLTDFNQLQLAFRQGASLTLGASSSWLV